MATTRTTAEPTRIDPLGIYDDGTARLILGVTSAAMARARREGRLRYSRQGRRVIYRGQWIIDWLERDADRMAEGAAHA